MPEIPQNRETQSLKDRSKELLQKSKGHLSESVGLGFHHSKALCMILEDLLVFLLHDALEKSKVKQVCRIRLGYESFFFKQEVEPGTSQRGQLAQCVGVPGTPVASRSLCSTPGMQWDAECESFVLDGL